MEYRDARGYKKRDAVAVSHRVAAAAMAEAPTKHTPQSYKEAMSGPDKKTWAHAIVQQLGKWQKRGIGTLVKRQPGMEVVRIRWVFQWKPDGRAKARIAAKGFDQTLGVSYSESFSPTLKMTSLRLFFHLCVEHGLDIFSDDVVAAFISSSLGEDEVYLQVPEGFDCPEGYVLKLRCAVEGLKQSSAKWTTKVDRILDHQGFKAVDAEACLYYKVTDGLLCLVARYVDDTLSGVHPSQKWVYDALIEAIMADGLELHRLGNAVGQKFLSIQTNWKPGSSIVVLDQKDYVRALAAKYPEIAVHRPVDTPMAPDFNPDAKSPALEDITEYQSLIGGLMWLVCCTCPTLMYAVCRLAQHMAKPSEVHRKGALRVLAYALQHLDDLSLEIGGGGLELRGYADSDYASDSDRKSVSGFVYFVGNTTLCWASRKQKNVVLSSTEAELNSLVEAVKEALWLAQVCGFMAPGGVTPITIHQDNLGCVAIAEKGRLTSRSKHMQVRLLWIHEHITCKDVLLGPVRTEHMLADPMTKAMDGMKTEYFCPFLQQAVSPVPPELSLMHRAGEKPKTTKQKWTAWRRTQRKAQRSKVAAVIQFL